MGGVFTKQDFYYVYTDEPHATRRKEILKKYPEIKNLMGHDWRISIQAVICVLLQIIMAILIRESSWKLVFLVAYIIGGTINHSLALALHELTHNLAFGHSRPMFTLKKYHLDHHRFQGDGEYDTDIPTNLEVMLFSTRLGKLVFLIIMPFLYAFRPIFVLPKAIHLLEVINFITAFLFNFIMYYYFGGKATLYFTLSTILGLSIHPISGHFIAEHYVFIKGHETYSYYGPLNWITYNVGYHNEHHDFPFIPGYRLPKVRQIAAEYYDNLPHYDSWTKVLYDFVMNRDVGPWSRVIRPSKMGKSVVISQQEYEKQVAKAQN
ncbi:unnamed protein product [Didymodactylos carnosus]|uniref:Sphingolipid delta4-desaturase N-terminal domain-containing protein n=1 Tax=Didymodactylos carnosus TaxID=1234261 RepID=A0A8S2E8F6_9BILA|nr:unnamed protein product [Didymodactylos carnosus]CAF3963210.1 unnamed protein product [Didymodactylos carnosus]